MRIVGGRWGGRRIQAAAGSRPTSERAREALFSIWGGRLAGSRFLDAFCGGGAIGLEAASRGAATVVFVDSLPAAMRVLESNCEALGVEGVTRVRMRLPSSVERLAGLGRFELAFADPPYDFTDYERLLGGLGGLLEVGGELALEHRRGRAVPERVEGLERRVERHYGDSSISFFSALGQGLE